ncbi:diguanylate cyclase with GAF sensor [Babesia caballi]|uniref:Diguanylate cyclase with GAF sensor n=1 Tax=Babesia caballi TaxID=5871 RepID=A0AAV4LNM3_BABCB|nr:diguanylate cyclase with GAF sensor [Babesia caballi]
MERGEVGTFAALFAVVGLIVFTWVVAALAIMATARHFVALKARADMGDNLGLMTLVNLTPKPATPPTTLLTVGTCALRIQKVELELQCIGIVRKRAE